MEAVREKKRTKNKRPKQAGGAPSSAAVVSNDEDVSNEIQTVEDFEEISAPSEESITHDYVITESDVVEQDPDPAQQTDDIRPKLDENPTADQPHDDHVPSAPRSVHKDESSSTVALPVVPAAQYEEYKPPDLSQFHSEMEQPLPSAPELCDLDFYQIQKINQAILSDISHIQLQPTTVHCSVQLEPFTDLERNQYYFNAQLGTVLSFELLAKKLFADQHDQMGTSQLYRELENYYHLQADIHNLSMDIIQLQKAFPKIREKIWTVAKTYESFSKRCREPCKNTKSINVSYLKGTYNEKWAISFEESLNNYVDLCCEKFRGKVILRDMQMLTISTLVQEIIDHCSVMRRDELRVTLTTLFHFVVKKTATKDFKDNVKNWLERVLVVFNKFSLLDDQLFLMSHVLRCPTDAARQVVKAINIAEPSKGLGGDLIDDWLAVLWMCLRPIRQWQKKSNEQVAEHDTNWEIVDSEGEDAEEDGGSAKFPNEVIFLDILDRIPFRRIFECLLNIHEMEGEIALSAHRLLRIIIFSSSFVGVVTEGLANYQKERYKTFLKRLAGIVKWNADLVTALFDFYKSSSFVSDAMVVGRLTTEYNIFMIRVCEHLVKSKSVLQYLSQLNFSHLDVNTYWKLNYYLLTSFPADPAVGFHEDFREIMKREFSFSSSQCTISQWSAEELIFILETFSTLSIACGPRDQQFIECVVRNLFHVGYLREGCYKVARDMIMTVAGNYPAIIEIILEDIQMNLSVISDQALYILKELPYDDWKPTMDTVDVIADMLENYTLDSVQHNIGKLLVSYMNWGFTEHGQLALGHEYHCKVALMVLSATIKKFPRLESYRRVTLAGIDSDSEKRYVAWAWKMITKLRLHSMDQGAAAKLQKAENNATKVIPSMKMEFIPTMQRLVEVEENPLAIYISLLTCDLGNDTEEVLFKGLRLLVKLLDNTPYFIINRCLELIVPLFLNSPNGLINSEHCSKVIEAVLAEEKSLLGLQFSWKPNEVISGMAEMIVNQIMEFNAFGWEMVRRVTWLWVMLLTKNPNWFLNNNCLFVLENMFQISATIPGLLDTYRDAFYPLILELKLKTNGGRKTFIPKNSITFPWCTLLFLELDFICYEQVPNIWIKFVNRMSVADKRNVNQIVKELTADYPYSPSELSVFKWADFLLKLDAKESVFSMALIQFWMLANQCSEIFEYNPGLLKKLQAKLVAASQQYRKESLSEKDPILKRVYQNLDSLFLGVAEKRDSLLQNSLDNQNGFVLDYVYMPSLRGEVRKMADHWRLIAFRQDIKRRGTPSSHLRTGDVPLREKKLRITEIVKLQKDPELFTVPTVEFHVDGVLKDAAMCHNFTLFLVKIKHEYCTFRNLVAQQQKLERQLYMEKLNSYEQTVWCSCLSSLNIPVRYKELIKSNENGDKNLAELLICYVDEKSNRDLSLVKYIFSVLHYLRLGIAKCEDGDHSECDKMVEKGLKIFKNFDEIIFTKFNFVATIATEIKERMKILTRRHCSSYSNATINVIFENPSVASMLMDMLGPDQMDDGLYKRNLQRLLSYTECAAGDTLELCMAHMKLSDRASRVGITESYRRSLIDFAFENLPRTRNRMFNLLAKEIFIVMLRQIDVFPHVMQRTFNAGNKTKHLLDVLYHTLGLTNAETSRSDKFELPVERLNQIDHLFSFEAVDWAVTYLAKSPKRAVDVAFYELLVFLLVRTNSVNGSKILHSKIAAMYQSQIIGANSREFVANYFKALKYLPDENYLGDELRSYLKKFSAITGDQKEPIAVHKEYAVELEKLPWHKFTPNVDDLTEMYRALWAQNNKSGHVSVIQSTTSHIAVKIDWRSVIENWQIDFSDADNVTKMFFIAIRIPYEMQSDENMFQFYDSIEGISLSWSMLSDKYLGDALNWIVMSAPQFAFIPQLGAAAGPTVEKRMLKLLLQCANVCGPNMPAQTLKRDSWADSKRQKLITAMTRMFSMGTSSDTNRVQEALKSFIATMTFHYNQVGTECTGELEYFQGEMLKLLDDKALSGPFFSVIQSHIDQCDNEWFVEVFLRTLTNVEVVTKTRIRLFEVVLRNFFLKCVGNNLNPWATIEQMSLTFVLKLRLDHLKELELFLSLHLFVTCKLRMCENGQQRIVFLEDFINWLPNVQFTEENEVYLLLLWCQMVCIGAGVFFQGGGTAILEKTQKYLKSVPVLRENGWGKSLANAMGLVKMQKQELCIRYIVYLLIKCFPELRESATESSVKFAQQFEADAKSSKMSNFKPQLDDLFGSGQSMVPNPRENLSANLIQFTRVIYTTTGSTDWFKNVHNFWRIVN